MSNDDEAPFVPPTAPSPESIKHVEESQKPPTNLETRGD
jgi:hypothetical protein